MNEGVTNQDTAEPENTVPEVNSDKELNFRRLEAARDAEKEARMRAEWEAESLRKEIEAIKEMLKPKELDPLDDVEDYVDRDRLKAKLQQERTALERKAREIAKETFQEIENEKQEREKKNFHSRLRNQFQDYDQIMNESNIATLEKIDPLFLETVCAIPDEYERRLKTYKKIKSLPKPEEKASIQEKVAENQQNPYYLQAGSGTPTAVEFDVSSKAARQAAYEKLKAAQRRPISGGHSR